MGYNIIHNKPYGYLLQYQFTILSKKQNFLENTYLNNLGYLSPHHQGLICKT